MPNKFSMGQDCSSNSPRETKPSAFAQPKRMEKPLGLGLMDVSHITPQGPKMCMDRDNHPWTKKPHD